MTKKPEKKRRPLNAVKEQRAAYIFLIPALLGLSLITYGPLMAVFGISFTDLRVGHFMPNTPLPPPQFVGFDNYINIFTNPMINITNSIFVTVYYALFAVGAGVAYSMFIAVLLNRKMPGRTFFRSVFYLPYILPAVAVIISWHFLLIYDGGVVNYILVKLGLPRSLFFDSAATAVPTLVMISLWTCGNLIVIFLAGLQNVPRVYQEAAEVDGANSWQRFWRITIPSMTPIIFYNTLMALVVSLQIVIPALARTRGGPGNSTMFIAYLIYQEGFRGGQLATASAIAAVYFVIAAILAFILFATSKSWIFYEGGDDK